MIKRMLSYVVVAGIGATMLAACGTPSDKDAGHELVTRVPVTYEAPAQPTAAETATDAGGGETASVTLLVMDIYFDPADFSIATGATLVLDASGAAAPHNFEVAALGIDVDIAPGEVKEIVIEGAPGTYDYICNVPGHKEAGMVGKMTITEAGAAAAPAAAAEATAEPTAEVALEPLPTAFTIATVDDKSFDPRELTIPADVEVTLTLDNTTGTSTHNLTIADLKVDIDVAAGAKMDVVVVAPVGRYEFSSAEGMDKMAGMLGVIVAVDAPAMASAITIGAYDIYFDPATFEITADTSTTIIIDATSAAAPHNFAIDALGIDVDVAAGEKVEVIIDAPAGTYDFYCNVPGHKEAGMVGVLTVK
jgi:uncharacterized cupredoxin-like copper-binding protein